MEAIVICAVILGLAFTYLTVRAEVVRPPRTSDVLRWQIRAGSNGAAGRTLNPVIASGQADAESADGNRASLRRDGNPVDVLISLHEGTVSPYRASVIDRSRGGVRLAVPARIPVTSVIRIRAEHAPEGSPWVQLEVRRCDPRGEEWVIGCRFTEDHPWSILLLFG
jgi:hypothetical protein